MSTEQCGVRTGWSGECAGHGEWLKAVKGFRKTVQSGYRFSMGGQVVRGEDQRFERALSLVEIPPIHSLRFKVAGASAVCALHFVVPSRKTSYAAGACSGPQGLQGRLCALYCTCAYVLLLSFIWPSGEGRFRPDVCEVRRLTLL